MIHGAICGKFRIIHIAHKELMLQAIDKVDHLHIFLCDVPNIKRYASIHNTKQAITDILSKYDTPFTIHILSPEELAAAPAPSIQWDRLLLSKAPLNVIYDSKEIYGNTLIPNEYLNLFLSKSISASSIEKNPYDLAEAILIAPEFLRYMQKKVAIIWQNRSAATHLTTKLNDFFQTASLPRLSLCYIDQTTTFSPEHFDLILAIDTPLEAPNVIHISGTSAGEIFLQSVPEIFTVLKQKIPSKD